MRLFERLETRGIAEGKYEELIRKGSGFSSERRTLAAAVLYNSASKIFVDAALHAAASGLGEDKERRAARMGYDALVKARGIARELGNTELAEELSTAAVAVAASFNLEEVSRKLTFGERSRLQLALIPIVRRTAAVERVVRKRVRPEDTSLRNRFSAVQGTVLIWCNALRVDHKLKPLIETYGLKARDYYSNMLEARRDMSSAELRGHAEGTEMLVNLLSKRKND